MSARKPRRQTNHHFGLTPLRLESREVPALYNWTGGFMGLGTNWFDGSNWVLNGTNTSGVVPGPGDDATMGAQNPGGPPTITFNGTSGVRSLTMVRNLSITGGTFTMGSGIFNYGNYQLNGGSMDFSNGTFIQNAQIEGTGSLAIAAGRNVSLYATVINLPMNVSGSVDVPYLDSISGFTSNAAWTNAPASKLTVQGGTALFNGGLINHGTMQLEAVSAKFSPTGTVTVQCGADSTNSADGLIVANAGIGGKRRLSIAGTTKFDNLGAIQTNGIDLTINSAGIGSTFQTSGSLAIAAGTKLINGNFMTINYNGGPVTGGTWDWTQSNTVVNLNASFSNANCDLTMDSGTTVNGPGTLTNAAGRTITSNGTVFNAAVINQNAATLAATGRLQFLNTLTNHGAIQLTSAGAQDSRLDIHVASTNHSDGTITSLLGGGGSRRIDLYDGVTFDNQGSILVATRNLSIASANNPTPTFQTSGSLTIDPGMTLTTGSFMNVVYNGGSVTGGGTWSVTGSFTNFNLNANLTVTPAAGIVVDFTTINGPGQFIVGSGATFTTVGMTMNASVVNNGSFVQNGGSSKTNGSFTNSAGATINIQDTAGNNALVDFGNGLTNNGTLTFNGKNGNVVEAYVDAGSIANGPTGRIVSTGGTNTHRMRFYGGTGLNNQGTITLAGSNLIFAIFGGTPTLQNSGVVSIGTGTTFTSDTPLANSASGLLTGQGTFTGKVTGSGTVSPGSSPGLLTVFGNTTLGGFVAELNGPTFGTQYDRLAVNGTVTVGGPLTVKLGYPANVNDPFTIIDNQGGGSVTGTFTNLAEGAPVSFNGATATISYKGGTGNDVVLTMTSIPALPAAKVLAVQINDGTAQRSRVTSIQVSFNSVVNLPINPADAFTLTRQSTNVPVSLSAIVANGAGTTVKLTFTSGSVDNNSLADGRYTLVALNSQINNPGGPLDGDGNGTGGDDYTLIGTPANGLFRLFGDVTGDGKVDAADFGQFRNAFNSISPAPAYNAAFDFNNDGKVDAVDFGFFRTRFNTAV